MGDFPEIFELTPPLQNRLKTYGEIVLWVEIEEGESVGYCFPTIEAAESWQFWLEGKDDRAIEHEFYTLVGGVQ